MGCRASPRRRLRRAWARVGAGEEAHLAVEEEGGLGAVDGVHLVVHGHLESALVAGGIILEEIVEHDSILAGARVESQKRDRVKMALWSHLGDALEVGFWRLERTFGEKRLGRARGVREARSGLNWGQIHGVVSLWAMGVARGISGRIFP